MTQGSNDVYSAPTGTSLARFGNLPAVPVASVTLSGPNAGTVGAASTPFTAALAPTGGAIAGTVVVTPSDGGAGGTFAPTSRSLTQPGPSGTFTYTPASSGNKTISITNDRGLANPAPITFAAAATGAQLTTFTLTSAAASATYPFTCGVAFKKGDVPLSFITDLPNYQVTVMRRWNDGSVKHAIVSGRAPLTQNVARTVVIRTGTPPTGTALTASSIATAAPNASVQCGSIGSVNLTSLLASPVRTFVSGPEMVECHYRGAVGGGTNLVAWFHVRLYANGSVWIRAIVENGYFDNGSGARDASTTQTYVPTLTIGGVVAYNNAGAALSHYANSRYMAEGWIGTNPQIVPLVDVAYLRAARLVPNHSTAPASAVLSALTQTYAPMGHAAQTVSMGDTGYQEAIGLLPHWNAAFIASGDPRAFKATLAGSSALNSYPVVWRAKNTNLPIRPTDFPNWTVDGVATGGESQWSAGPLTWEASHFPGEGYLAYLLTGDYWHYETMAMNCATIYVLMSVLRGNGVNRMLSPGQIRGTAWSLRSMGLYTGLAPDADLVAGTPATDYRTLLANNYSTLQAVIANGPANMTATGCLWSAGNYGLWDTLAEGAEVTGTIPPWQLDFFAATNGFLSDIEPLSSTAALTAVRDWMYRWPVGRLGPMADTTQYGFCDAGQYGLKVASTDSDSTWFASWGAIYTASQGFSNAAAGNALRGGNFPNMDSYWANLQPAISYAVDHLAQGSPAAYLRMVGASNWASLLAQFNQFSEWAVSPRTPPQANVPSWLGPVGQWTNAPNSSLTGSGVGWSGTNPGSSQGINGNYTAVVNRWSSGVLASDGVFRGGSYVTGPHLAIFGAGHNDYGGNEVYAYGPLTSDTPTWARLTDPTVPGPVSTAGPPPSATHTYDMLQYDAATKKMIVFGIGASYPSGNSGNQGYTFSFTVNPATTQPWGQVFTAPAQSGAGYIKYKSAMDPLTGLFWGLGLGNGAQVSKLDPTTMTITNFGINNPQPDADVYTKGALDPVHHIFVYQGAGRMVGIDLRTPGSGLSLYTIATTGTGPSFDGLLGIEWDVANARFVAWNNSGKTLYFLTPSTSPYAGGTAWTWTSTTPSSGATPANVNLDNTDGRLIVGRFRIVDGGTWRGVVVMPNETGAVCVFRLA